jgi:hypothetical protein
MKNVAGDRRKALAKRLNRRDFLQFRCVRKGCDGTIGDAERYGIVTAAPQKTTTPEVTKKLASPQRVARRGGPGLQMLVRATVRRDEAVSVGRMVEWGMIHSFDIFWGGREANRILPMRI